MRDNDNKFSRKSSFSNKTGYKKTRTGTAGNKIAARTQSTNKADKEPKSAPSDISELKDYLGKVSVYRIVRTTPIGAYITQGKNQKGRCQEGCYRSSEQGSQKKRRFLYPF